MQIQLKAGNQIHLTADEVDDLQWALAMTANTLHKRGRTSSGDRLDELYEKFEEAESLQETEQNLPKV